ncbi:MAG: 30S ribosomal protein S6 [Proteobacteria bacterium]|nr:30S ribosomal protein S6 [Pseudomonadota bacterium]MBU1389117.1 30S ribosomal protein S6 [Pseudomonadota bacterium]MBU1543341.1 30S ribosomal protein S6 [Pseudomonadota bacterium]MBU2479820.1 30S ribosomal protein S6 [Pseudomonadota bacterium]
MRKYETVFISDPDLKDQTRLELFDRVREIIAKENGIIIDFDDWGNKKLAYEIRKKARGHYVCITYGGSGDLVKELERNFRLSEMVMKFMTIVVSEDMTVQEIELEVKKAQEDAKARAERKPEETTDETDETGEDETDDTEDSSTEDETTEETSN